MLILKPLWFPILFFYLSSFFYPLKKAKGEIKITNEPNVTKNLEEKTKANQKSETKENFIQDRTKEVSKKKEASSQDLQMTKTHFSLLYNKAIRKYQEKEFDESKEIFYQLLETLEKHKTLKKEINLSSLFYNLGLTEYQTKNHALAIAWLRKTVFISPLSFQARKALKPLESKLKILEGNEKNYWYQLRTHFFSYFSLNFILSLTGLILGAYLFFGLKLSKREQEFEETSKIRPFSSTLRLSLLILLFVSLTLSTFKIYDSLNPWATVTSTEAKLHITPRGESTILLNLKPGSEVILKEKKGEWFRVLSLNGTMGWIQENFLFQTTTTQASSLPTQQVTPYE